MEGGRVGDLVEQSERRHTHTLNGLPFPSLPLRNTPCFPGKETCHSDQSFCCVGRPCSTPMWPPRSWATMTNSWRSLRCGFALSLLLSLAPSASSSTVCILDARHCLLDSMECKDCTLCAPCPACVAVVSGRSSIGQPLGPHARGVLVFCRPLVRHPQSGTANQLYAPSWFFPWVPLSPVRTAVHSLRHLRPWYG